MRHATLIAALILSTALPTSAQDRFRARNGLFVVPETARTFNVPFRGVSDDNEFWCAAGDYTLRVLRLPGRTPLFRLTPPPRRQGQGIRFSLDPQGASETTGVSIMGNSGPANSVSASIARGLCEEFIPRFGRF